MTGLPSKLSRVVPSSFQIIVGLKVGVESTSEQHNCASFGAFDLSYDGERIEDAVSQGDRYAFLLLTVAWVGAVRHLRGEAVVPRGCSPPVFRARSQARSIHYLAYMSQPPIYFTWSSYLLLVSGCIIGLE